MQAITTKYLSPSNTKPGRIKAECEAGQITISYSHDFDVEGCHRQAALFVRLWSSTKREDLTMSEQYLMNRAVSLFPAVSYLDEKAVRHARRRWVQSILVLQTTSRGWILSRPVNRIQ